MASPTGPSPNTGLRVSPGLLNALNGPRGWLWRALIAGFVALFAGIIVANEVVERLTPGSAFVSGLVCPPGYRASTTTNAEEIAEVGRRLSKGRGIWFACRDAKGTALRSQQPHDKLVAYATYASAPLLFFPIHLLLARILRNAVPLIPGVDDDSVIGDPRARRRDSRRKPVR